VKLGRHVRVVHDYVRRGQQDTGPDCQQLRVTRARTHERDAPDAGTRLLAH